MARLAALALLTALSVALTLGYLGRVHPAFDSFAHFRVHLSIAIAVAVPLLLLLRLRLEAVFAALFAATALVQTIGGGFASPLAAQDARESAIYRLLHLNLLHDNPTPEAVLSLVGSIRPDIVTFNEVSERWAGRLATIEAAYPYRLICPPPTRVGGVAILSRRPFAEGFEAHCGDGSAFAHARLDMGGRILDVATLHAGWPWPFEQPAQLPRLAPLLAATGGTAIVTGDFNATPWSHAARQLAASANARMLRGIGPTWLFRRLPDWLRATAGLPIDNIMVKGGVVPGQFGTLAGVGSDHLPVLLEFTLLPEEAPPEVLQAQVGG